MIRRIRSSKEYELVMKSIEGLLTKAKGLGGFHRLGPVDAALLEKLSLLAENYEDKTLHIMPIRVKTLREAIELQRTQRKLTQAGLARLLGVRPPKLSQILTGKRKPDVAFLKAVHRKLKLDAAFVLEKA